jgi:DNA-binding response OmpR family regulator
MEPTNILFVDDEPGITETFPAILRAQGFPCTCASTVSDALREIASNGYDVLISDLNIGQPGDGFTVVSAMRRTHPDCICFILTGYPGFESALQAIRSQVDDYLIKPAHPGQVIAAIKAKLNARTKNNPAQPNKRIAVLLREHAFDITRRAVAHAKADPDTGLLNLTDEQRIGHIPAILSQLAQVLGSSEEFGPEVARTGAQTGELRRTQGIAAPLLVRQARFLQCAIYEVARENLLELNLSYLMLDLKRLSDVLFSQLEYAVKAVSEPDSEPERIASGNC